MKQSLDILEHVTRESAKKAERATELLKPVEGAAPGWFMHVPSFFNSALDILQTTRVTEKKQSWFGRSGAFDNVPRRFLGKSPLTHAVAYADGSTALLPAEEFRKLDLAQFVDVTTVPEKKVEPEAPPEPPPRAASSEAHD